jgi:hypothetical protein
MDLVTICIILFLAIYLIAIIYLSYTPRTLLEGFDDTNSIGFLMMAPTSVPPDATLVNIGTMPTMTVQNHAKINAKYEYDERYDESRINFNVKIPQTLSSTYDLNDDMYSPYQIKGFCNALNSTSETIEEKCNQLDVTTCANTACCVLYGGTKCVAGDERGPTFEITYKDPNVKNGDKYYYMGNCYGNCSNYIATEYDRIETPSNIDKKVLRDLDSSYNESPLYFTNFYNTSATTTPPPSSGTTAPWTFQTYATSPPYQYVTMSTETTTPIPPTSPPTVPQTSPPMASSTTIPVSTYSTNGPSTITNPTSTTSQTTAVTGGP